MILRALTFLFLISLSATLSAETNLFARAHLDEERVFLGEPFSIDLIVRAPEAPRILPVEVGAELEFATPAAATPLSTTNTWHVRISAIPKRGGSLQIPAFPFEAAGRQFQSEGFTIECERPQRATWMHLACTPSRERVYVGEPFLLRSTWTSERPLGVLRSVDLHFPILNRPEFTVHDPFEPGKDQLKDVTGLPVHGTRVLATREDKTVEGVPVQSLRFEKVIQAREAGTLSIPAATLLCASDRDSKGKRPSNAFQYPAYFDNVFFDRDLQDGNFERNYVESSPIRIEVLPLPTEGRPAEFRGLVGRYGFEVSADRTKLPLGETVLLTIAISSSGRVEHLRFPDLAELPVFEEGFRVVADRELPTIEGDTAIFRQSVRVLDARVQAVPALSLSFFDPVKGRYTTLRSSPIPLEVHSAVATGTVASRKAEPSSTGDPSPPREHHRSRLRIGLPAASSILITFLAVVVLQRLSSQGHFAFPGFRLRVARISFGPRNKKRVYGLLGSALRHYFANHLDLQPGALTASDVERHLRDRDAGEDLLQRVRDLFDRCDAYRFTVGYDEMAPLRSIRKESLLLLSDVNRLLRHHRRRTS